MAKMNETFQKKRKRLIREVKDCGQDLINRPEDFIGSTDTMTDFNINIRFSISGDTLPAIAVTREYYPKTIIERYTRSCNGCANHYPKSVVCSECIDYSEWEAE